MKQYFAKYLPVEGEIKELDKFNSVSGELPGSQHVRLFLCSRDIQVKDLKPREDVFYDDKGMTHEVTQSWIDGRTTFPHTWFKVIGEISPEAIWVKEGDEFSKEEVMGPIQMWVTAVGHKDFMQIKCPICKKFH